jgi:hypothetical protein
MTTRTRLQRVLASAVMAACLVLSGGSGVFANGFGDLYVGSAAGIDELRLKTENLENFLGLTPGPTMLAFRPDGKVLFASDGSAQVTRIDINHIVVDSAVTLKVPAVALAHPRGTALFIAYRDQRTLGTLQDGDSTLETGQTLPGNPDILAADRHEARLVAAERGKPWITIIDPVNGKLITVGKGATGIGGDVVAIAVGRDEGYAYVATTSPNRVARIDLDTGLVDGAAPLDGAPTAIAAVKGAAVVAFGSTLSRVAGSTRTPFATADGPVLALAGSDEGKFAYVATATTVTAFPASDPAARPVSQVTLPHSRPTVLAPVPADSSLAASSTGGKGSPGAGGSDGAASGRSLVPATDTSGGGPLFLPPGQDLTVVLGVAAVLAIVVLLGSRKLIARLSGEG